MNKEKVIAFYISDHGFGHASRNIPIIRYILKAYKNVRIIVKTGKAQGEFINSLICKFDTRVEYYFDYMHIGLILKEGYLDIDKLKLEKEITKYINTFDERILKEKEFF